MNIDNIKKYYEQAKKENLDFAPMMNRIYQFIQNYNTNWGTTNSNIINKGGRTDTKIYATNIAQYADEFANYLTNLVFPYGVKFFNLHFEGTDNSIQQNKEIVYNASEKIFNYLENSNFYQEIPKAFRDLTAGTGALIMNYNLENNSIYFKALDVSRLYFLEDDFSIPNYVFRDLGNLSYLDRLRQYPNINFNSNEDLSLIEYVIPFFENKKRKFKYVITNNDFKTEYFTMVWDTNPFIIFRWNTDSNENIGRGILCKHLSTLNLIDELESSILKGTEIALNPMFITNDNDFIKNNHGIDFRAGSLIQIGYSTELQQLPNNVNLPFARADINQKYQEIIDSLKIRTLSQQQQKEMTATEVQARMSQQINILGGFANRHIKELVIPLINRAIELLTKANIINKDTIKNHKLKYENPITILNKKIKMQDTINSLNYLNMIGGNQGQVIINSSIVRGKVAEEIMQSSGLDPSFYNNADEIEKNIEQVEQAQQQQQFLQMQLSNPNLQFNGGM